MRLFRRKENQQKRHIMIILILVATKLVARSGDMHLKRRARHKVDCSLQIDFNPYVAQNSGFSESEPCWVELVLQSKKESTRTEEGPFLTDTGCLPAPTSVGQSKGDMLVAAPPPPPSPPQPSPLSRWSLKSCRTTTASSQRKEHAASMRPTTQTPAHLTPKVRTCGKLALYPSTTIA